MPYRIWVRPDVHAERRRVPGSSDLSGVHGVIRVVGVPEGLVLGVAQAYAPAVGDEQAPDSVVEALAELSRAGGRRSSGG
jgi:hypothetical protein